jgi:hypothetical protein
MAMLGAPLAFLLLVGGGVAVRAQIHHPPLVLKPAAQAPAEKASPASVPAPLAAEKPTEAAPRPEPVAQPAVRPAAAPRPGREIVAARADRRTKLVSSTKAQSAPSALGPPATASAPVASAAPATIQLAILPWGEVFVNGKSRGVSPPLRSIEVAGGSHTIEIRNTSFPAHTQRVEVRAGEAVRIRHRFR